MAIAKDKMTFAIAARDFFGLLPGQSTADFVLELKNLSDADKDEFRAGLVANGYLAAGQTSATS